MEKLDLSIIILVYNAKGYLWDCVQSIKKSSLAGLRYEIIIVDNVSEDGSIEEIKKIAKAEKNVKTIFNKENLGFAKGNNTGVKEAKGNYVLFLNPDTILSKDALQKTFKFMQDNPQVGAAGGNLKLANGDPDTAAHRGFPTPWRAFSHFAGLRGVFPSSKIFAGYTLGWQIRNKSPHEVDSISGAFFFTRQTVGEKLGWWDEEFFMYGEDLDFCYRIKENGWKVMFLPGVHVLHYGGVSAGIRKHIRQKSAATGETRLRSAQASTKAMRIFYNKHYKNKYPNFLTRFVLSGIKILENFRIRGIRKN